MTIGEYVLPPLLGKYRDIHENIDVIMNVNNLEDILKKQKNGEIDLGIVEGPFDKTRFNYKKLKDDELVLVVSPLNSLAGGNEAGLEDIIKGGKLILREKGSGTRMVFENKLEELGYSSADIKAYMEIGSLGAIKSLVEANLGYTVISKEAVKREVEAGTLVIIPVHGVRFEREFNFVYLATSPLEFINDFAEFLINQVTDAE